MNVYLDTSVIMRRLLRDPQALPEWGRWTAAYASRIWLTEARRTVDRLRLERRIDDEDVANLHAEVSRVHAALHVIPLSEEILIRAGEPFATVLGTLDAIHLASALAIRSDVRVDCFLTHDRQLAVSARSFDFRVEGV